MISLTAIILYCIAGVYSQNSCVTPNGERALCLPLTQCPILYRAIFDQNRQTRSFLKQSQCAYQNMPFVCCGSVAAYKRPKYYNQAVHPIRFPDNQNNKPTTSKPRIQDPKQHRNIQLLPKYGKCGRQSLEDKVFGGKEAGLDEFPWLALLGYEKNGRDVGFHCGGFLIQERYVLTAAHCVTGGINRSYGNVYQVRLGEYNMTTSQDCVVGEGCNEPPTDVTVEEAFFHSGYNDLTSTRYHDIALLRLSKPIKMSYFVQPICLPLNGEQTSPGNDMFIAGWGRTENASTSEVKLKATVPSVSQRECNNAYPTIPIGNNQLCAGGVKGVDSCNGDSGGPIMSLLSDQESWYAEGLVSFGPISCGSENMPGVYTRIYGYIDWILDNMRP